ncbi:hypothetical protein [Fluviispira vulneris]|uniref:hypothetical protein n=1 Tax=Fluviispira vulneris TaxID=2763012 RepID=UPI00164620BA|nr:hypothetical protein [Fluviispira vulneris]
MSAACVPHLSELSQSIQLELTTYGGHVGFISWHSLLIPMYWLEPRIIQFFLAQIKN